MPRLSPRYRFAFPEFRTVIANALGSSGLVGKELDRGALTGFQRSLIREALKWLFPMAYINDSLFLMFLLVFMLKKFEWNDLSEIIHNLKSGSP